MKLEAGFLEEWLARLEWLNAGVNLSLCITAAVCVMIALIYLWRSYRLEALIVEYQEKEKKALEPEDIAQEKQSMVDFMVPMKLLELVGIRDVEDLSVEKQKQIQAVNMAVNSNDFSRIIHAMEAEEVFSYINAFLEKAVPLACQAGGVIEGFWEAGMSVLFLEDYGSALVAAISICGLWEESGHGCDSFAVGIHYEEAIVGIVGDRSRLGLLMLSAESAGLPQWLQSIAVKYYARILVTDTYAKLVTDFQGRFHSRLLGYVYIKDTDSVRKIYDIFDGDMQEVRSRKRQTKLLFEKGVALFAKQDYPAARQYFIEVLKNDRMDRAAKEYIYRCEAYIRDVKEGQIYIECYG